MHAFTSTFSIYIGTYQVDPNPFSFIKK